jgi:hypothetical protein
VIVIQQTGSMSFKGQMASFLNRLGFAWWIEVKTQAPNCTYYFGPFASAQEAETEKPGFIDDLEREQAQGIQAVVKRCQPSELTIFDEPDVMVPRKGRIQVTAPLP